MAEQAITQKEEKKKVLPLILIFTAVVAVIIAGYFLYQKYGSSWFGGTSNEPQTAEERLDQYFDNETKHGTFVYYDMLDETAATQDGEFWVKDGKFKIEFLQEDGYRRWILTPDGEIPYFCHEEDETCTVSMSTVENYMLRWSKPESDIEMTSTDEDNSCDLYVYDIDKIFEREGASNAYYIKNITYCVNEDKLVYRLHDGHSVSDDGSEGTRSYSKFVMGDLEYTVSDDVSFELPYEIVNN